MNQTLIVCHLPKASGTSLRAVLARQYNRNSIYKLDGRDAEKSVRGYRDLPLDEKLKIDEIDGHYPVGIHRYVPKPYTYITLVRNPIDRVVSWYYHVLGDPEHYIYRRGFTKETNLLELLQSDIARAELWNGQTWFLSGGISPQEKPAEALKMAKENLQNLFIVAGLTERFDESIILMRRRLQWRKIPVYYRRHVNVNRPRGKEISQETLQAIGELNKLDLELYDYVGDKLNREIISEGLSFTAEVGLFRSFNFIYQTLLQLRFFAGKTKRTMLGN